MSRIEQSHQVTAKEAWEFYSLRLDDLRRLEVEEKPSPYGDESIFVYNLPDVVTLALKRRTSRELLDRKCRYLVLEAFRNARWKRKFWLDGPLQS